MARNGGNDARDGRGNEHADRVKEVQNRRGDDGRPVGLEVRGVGVARGSLIIGWRF